MSLLNDKLLEKPIVDLIYSRFRLPLCPLLSFKAYMTSVGYKSITYYHYTSVMNSFRV